jgi:hypothetical protein
MMFNELGPDESSSHDDPEEWGLETRQLPPPVAERSPGAAQRKRGLGDLQYESRHEVLRLVATGECAPLVLIRSRDRSQVDRTLIGPSIGPTPFALEPVLTQPWRA